MFIEERHQKILEIIKEFKRVEVLSLSKHFKVSEDTIRRDLRIMEDKGWIKKTHGGAILPDKTGFPLTLKQREKISTTKKQNIAKLAIKFIEDNDTIFLDGSTTIAKLIPFLIQKNNITVFTNSISISNDIINHESNIKLYLIGGLVEKRSGCTISTETYENIKKINVDKVFSSVCSISAKWGLSTPLLEEAPIQKAMLEAGRNIFLLIDSSKFGVRSLTQIGPILPEYIIITDNGLTNEMMNNFKDYIKKGLKIIKP